MNKDIILLDEIMSFKNKDDIKERRFFWLYPFTNENIKAYYKYIDFESAYNIQTRKKYGFSGNNKDLVLLTKNKKQN